MTITQEDKEYFEKKIICRFCGKKLNLIKSEIIVI